MQCQLDTIWHNQDVPSLTPEGWSARRGAHAGILAEEPLGRAPAGDIAVRTAVRQVRRQLRRLSVALRAAGTVAVTGVVLDVLGVVPGEWPILVAAVVVLLVPIAVGPLAAAQEAFLRSAREAIASEARMLATTNEWVWSSDPEGVLTSSNAAVERILDRRVEELVGRDALTLLHPDDRAAAAARLRSPETQRDGWTDWLLRWRHRDGSYRWLESSGVPVTGPGGRLEGYRGSDRDVTDDILRRRADAAEKAAVDEKRERVLAVVRAPEGRLRMLYQPIVAVNDGHVVGVEALSRFVTEPVRPPDRWFAEAAEVGLGSALELTAVRAALNSVRLLPAGYISVNLSPDTIVSEAFRTLLAEADFPARRLVVELTEQVMVDEYSRLRVALDDMRATGVRLAVDDTGAGYASLQHVLELRPDVIKLDQGIVRGIDGDPVRYALAVALAEFGAQAGAQVVAEGVETEGEFHAVRNAGIPCVQGFLVARPASLPIRRLHLPLATGTPKVMIVDDDPVVRLLVSRMARHAGLEIVGQASDGREGIALAVELRPDVVILDLAMPVLGGLEALPTLRAAVPDAEIVVVSSRLEASVDNRLRLQGVAFVVDKQETSTRLPGVLAQLASRFDSKQRIGC